MDDEARGRDVAGRVTEGQCLPRAPAYVDPGHVRAWRMLLDDATEAADRRAGTA